MTLPIEQMLNDVAILERETLISSHMELIQDICCHVKALVAEVDRLNGVIKRQAYNASRLAAYEALDRAGGVSHD